MYLKMISLCQNEDEKYNHLVKEICDEVYQHSDETECVYKKSTKRFSIKGNTCVINPKSSERFNDEPMKIEIGM